VSYKICAVGEHEPQDVQIVALSGTCDSKTNLRFTNPNIVFASDPTKTASGADFPLRTFPAEKVTLVKPVVSRARAFVLTRLDASVACDETSPVQQVGNNFLRVGSTYYKHDPRLQMLTNTLKHPANVSAMAGASCPTVPRSFLNEASCSRRTSTCTPLEFSSTMVPLNEIMLRQWYALSQRHVLYMDGLTLGSPYDVSPCYVDAKGKAYISRWWRRGTGTCVDASLNPTAGIDNNTLASIVAALTASTDTHNTFSLGSLRDVNVRAAAMPDGDSCQDASVSVGAIVEVTADGSAKGCWENVHPDRFTVYDATYWTLLHPGNEQAAKAGKPNPIKRFAETGQVKLQFPSWHTLKRWKDNKKWFPQVGRMGDTVDFQSLVVELQTERMASLVGAVAREATSGFEACGSPGETANVPVLGNLYHFSDETDKLGFDSEELEFPYNKNEGQPAVWMNAARAVPDQLRHRFAWSISQILTLSTEGLGKQDQIEPYMVYYDIFVRHAFGNFKDILREVSFNPMMMIYLTFHQNKAFAFSGKFPDENYAREIMQLFSIGLWKLNQDGTRKLDPKTQEPMQTYTNDDIMAFSRVWTGFDRQGARGNLPTPGNANAANVMDPAQIKTLWRDVFPKTNLAGGYLGDTYHALCSDLPKGSFLLKGSKYRLTGEVSMEGQSYDNAGDVKKKRGRFKPNADTSSLYAKLCARPHSGAPCAYPSEVVLDENVACDGMECSVDRIRVVQMDDGNQASPLYYHFIPSSCVKYTFFDNTPGDGTKANVLGKTIVSQPRNYKQCANPSLPVAGIGCCDRSTGDMLQPEGSAVKTLCRFAAEFAKAETAEQRCNAYVDKNGKIKRRRFCFS
jgi:hypothetical protein